MKTTEKTKMKICPDCLGNDEILSSCCGASIDTDILICSDCKDHSDVAVCETCDGEGEVLITNITDEQYSKSINHWNYFVLNFDYNFLDVFGKEGTTIRKHYTEKFAVAYKRAGSTGAMISFWATLDNGNRRKLTDWVKENYKGSPL